MNNSLTQICLLALILGLVPPSLHAAAPQISYDADRELLSLNFRNVDIAEVMEMMSRKHRINILLGSGVQGSLSLNLYDVSIAEAIHAIANAAGYAVDRRGTTYFVVPHSEVGKYGHSTVTDVKSFEIHYADPSAVATLLQPYLSSYGQLTAIPERKLIVVEDEPGTVRRLAALIREVDQMPQQILIEAKILEVTLNDEESFGLDWAKLFDSDGGSGTVGTQGLSGPGSSNSNGLFFDLATPNVEVTLNALEQQGRVQTLSTPTLLALENQEASVIIGDRRGYQVTTTINQVTTESVEFLESGVILRVSPHIDTNGRIMMNIHPEVSNGTVDSFGVPSQTTTEVTTSLVVPDGETVFIGGLMKHTAAQSRSSVPLIGRVPMVKHLFSSQEQTNVNTETVVLITPKIVDNFTNARNVAEVDQVDRVQVEVDHRKRDLERRAARYDCVSEERNGLFEEVCELVE
ncbi:MAG: type II secretion system protein GspD [Pseudomonadales bacterium]